MRVGGRSHGGAQERWEKGSLHSSAALGGHGPDTVSPMTQFLSLKDGEVPGTHWLGLL